MSNNFDDDDEYNEFDAEDYDETDYDELDYEEDDNDSESILHYWNNDLNEVSSKTVKRHNNTGCCCIAFIVPILILAFIIIAFAF